MLVADVHFSLWIALGILLIAGLVIASRRLSHARSRMWQRFAQRHELTYEEREGRPIVHGQIDGRPFQLCLVEDSSDTGVLGVEAVVMTLGIQGEVPEGLEISESNPLIGRVQSLVEGDDVKIGDPEFDEAVILKAADPRQVAAYLTPIRKQAIVRLLSLKEECSVGISGAMVVVQEREFLSQLDLLEKRLRLMREVASVLDGD